MKAEIVPRLKIPEIPDIKPAARVDVAANVQRLGDIYQFAPSAPMWAAGKSAPFMSTM